MTRKTALILSAAMGALALSACTPPAPQMDVFRAEDIPHAQLSGNVVPQNYRVDLVMDPNATGMSGTVMIEVDVQKPTDKIWLHGKEMTVSRVVLDAGGQVTQGTFNPVPLTEAPSGVAAIDFAQIIPAGPATITIDFETPYNQALNSAYQVKRGDDAYIVTQFEPLGAREAFPSFDEPKYKVPFTLSITAPKEDFVYANTPETKAIEVEYEQGGQTWMRHEFATTRPLPTYLVAFGAGPYDVVVAEDIPPNSVRKTPLELRGITAKGSGEEIRYGLAGTEPILRALEEYFGTPYPYEKLDLIAAPDYAFGAMENPGAIVYREYLMLLNEGSPLSQKRSYNGVHSHELAHQWFGNLVTPVWWEDIWLNEAFATWMGNKGTSMAYPDGNYDRNTLRSSLGAMNIDSLSTTRRVREPLARSENVMDQFDGITYRKGGGVLDMFESYVGEAAFQKGVRLHMDRYADGVATGDDFFQSIADGSGNADVVDAMKSFVDQPGVPLVTGKMIGTTDHCDAIAVQLSQSRYAPMGSTIEQGQFWQIPVCVSYGNQSGAKAKQCVLLKEKDAELEFVSQLPKLKNGAIGNECPTYMTFNQNGAGYYRFTLGTEGWAQLIENLDQLNTREVLSAQDSLLAAYRAGEVESAVLLAGMEAFARHPEYDVAAKAGDLLGFIYDELPEARNDIARLVQDMYAQRYKATVGKDTVEADLLVPTMAANLVARGADKKLQADFAAKGARYLGLSGKADKKAIAPNLLSRALHGAMQTQPEAASAPLLALVKSGSSFEKGAAIGALGSTTDKDIAATLRARALSDQAGMTGRQALSLISVMMDNEALAEDTWTWLQDNFEGFVTARVPDVRKGGLPGLTEGFCSLTERDAAKQFFEANAAIIPGSERSLRQTLERITLCAGLKDAKSTELTAALAAR